MTKEESLAKASKKLMLREPFYALILMALNKVWDNRIPTACVSVKNLRYELKISEEFWNTLDVEQQVEVLKHELLHIAFFHVSGNYDDLTNRHLLNVAMDIVVNQYLIESILPGEPATLTNVNNKFGLSLKPKMGTRYYYEELSKAFPQNQGLQIVCQAGANGEVEVTLPDGSKFTIPDHDWDIENLPEAAKKVLDHHTQSILKEVADQIQKSRGTIPGEMSEIIDKILNPPPPKFNWRLFLRRFIGKSIDTKTKKSRRKYNKRMPDFPGLKKWRKKHILVAVDTSGSVSTEELREFQQEMYHISKQGVKITLVEIDSDISHISEYDHTKQWEVHGRGGTNFQPAVDYYRDKRGKFSCLIYFTDGEAPAPTGADVSRTLWVLSSRSNDTKLPGTVIKLPK